MTIPTANELLVALLKNVGDPAHCKGCGADIYWVIHRNGKKVPYTPAGLNHFVDCPAAQRFRKAVHPVDNNEHKEE